MEGIALSIGDSTTIALKGAQTSGCIWLYDVTKNGLVDIEKVYSGNDLFSSLKNKSEDTFQITALNKGIARITFKQVHLWDADTHPAYTSIVEVYVA